MPSSIIETRRNNLDMYMDFFTLFVAPVVGKKRFEDNCCRQKLSDFVTISDEALALILFDNNYDRWLDMGKNNDWTKSLICPRYTTGGNAIQTPRRKKSTNENITSEKLRDSTCAKYQGWSIEGIKKYNIFFEAVEKERNSELGKLFEDTFQKVSKQIREDNSKKPSKEPVFEMCRHELWNDTSLDSGKSIVTVSTNSCMTDSNSNMEHKTNVPHFAV